MLKSNKNVFWEALIVTIAIFLMGLFLGIMVETRNSNRISSLYTKSEINLVDGMAILRLSEDLKVSCDTLREENIDFADRVYLEAKLLEEYETSGKLTESMKDLHKKYDLLRTLLWMSNQNSLNRCNNYNLVVYLYAYETEENDKKAIQNVWSKILLDLKNDGKDILLLPIAADQNLASLNILMKEYEISKLPAIVIDNKKVVYDLQSMDDIKSLLS